MQERKLREIVLKVTTEMGPMTMDHLQNVLFNLESQALLKLGNTVVKDIHFIKTKTGVRIPGFNGVINRMIRDGELSLTPPSKGK